MPSAGIDVPCVPCGKSELDFESIPMTQTVVDGEYSVSTGPKSSLDSQAPMEFEIEASGDDYLDLSETYLRLLLVIRNHDDTPIELVTASGEPGSQRDVGPVNLPLHSFFSQVELILNDTLVSSSNNTYAYRAMLSSLLSYSISVKVTWLGATEGFRVDEPDKADRTGNKSMHTFCDEKMPSGKMLELIGRPHVDLCHQERLIPNGVKVRFRFTRSPNEFFMMSHSADQKPFKIIVKDARLEARRVKLNASEQLRLEKVIATHGARYPLTHVVTKNFTVAQGTSSIDIDSLFTGQIPNKVVLGMVANEAFNGAYDKSPFNFKHYNLISACLIVDGKQIPTKGMIFDFDQGVFLDGYIAMLQCSGSYPSNFSNGISSKYYTQGNTLLCFDLSPDLNGSAVDHVTARRNGTVKASLRFKNALPETVTLVAYAQYDNMLMIDRNRSVLYDYVN